MRTRRAGGSIPFDTTEIIGVHLRWTRPIGDLSAPPMLPACQVSQGQRSAINLYRSALILCTPRIHQHPIAPFSERRRTSVIRCRMLFTATDSWLRELPRYPPEAARFSDAQCCLGPFCGKSLTQQGFGQQ